MISVDRMSLYSTSTLVGGGEEEVLAEQQQSQRAQAERAYLARRSSSGNNGPHQPHSPTQSRLSRASTSPATRMNPNVVDLNEIASRIVGGGAPLSRQSSITTLHNQPTRLITGSQRSSHTPPNFTHNAVMNNLTPQDTDSDLAHDSNSPLSSSSSPPLRVPWWTPIVPNPTVGTSSRAPNTLIRNRLIRSMSDPDSDDFPAVTDYGVITASTSLPNYSLPSRAHQNMSTSQQASQSNGTTSLRNHTASQNTIIPPSPPELPPTYSIYTKWYCEENSYILAAYLSRICRHRNEIKNSRLRWDVDVILVSNKDQTVALWQQKAGLSAESDYQVIWDYHVFVILSCQKESLVKESKSRSKSLSSVTNSDLMPRRRSAMSRIEEEGGAPMMASTSSDSSNGFHHPRKPLQSWVYDLDSRISSPAPLAEYLSSTFGIDNGLGKTCKKSYRPVFRVIPASTYFTRFGSDRSHMKRGASSTNPDLFEWISPRPVWECLMGKKAANTKSYFMDSFVDMRIKIGDGRFGQVVKLTDLFEGHCLMSGGKMALEESSLASGVSSMLDDIEKRSRAEIQSQPTIIRSQSIVDPEWIATESQEAAVNQVASLSQDEEQQLTPGTIIGGVQRYGMRPPPPPPDGATISTLNRGKRVMDPMFPAYIASVYEHLAEA